MTSISCDVHWATNHQVGWQHFLEIVFFYFVALAVAIFCCDPPIWFPYVYSQPLKQVMLWVFGIISLYSSLIQVSVNLLSLASFSFCEFVGPTWISLCCMTWQTSVCRERLLKGATLLSALQLRWMSTHTGCRMFLLCKSHMLWQVKSRKRKHTTASLWHE